MPKFIYADHAATTSLSEAARVAMQPFLLDEYGNPSALYSMARVPRKAVQKARETIAECIHCLPEEILFTSGSTESDNWAIRGIALNHLFKEKHILTDAGEHHAILNSCFFLRNFDFYINEMPINQDGTVDLNDVKDWLDSDTVLMSIMLANNEMGSINDLAQMAEMAHKYGTIVHTDAVQAIGHIPVNVDQLQVDLLSASAHKFNGPKGVGFLYCRKHTPLKPLFVGGPQENHSRAGTENVAGIVGMAVALKGHISNLDKEQAYLKDLEAYFIGKLNEAGFDYRLNGNKNHIPGLLSVSFKGAEGEMILHRLDLQHIEVATGSACNSHETEVSDVLRAAGIPREYIEGTIRFSFGMENTKEEIDTIVNALKKILLK